MNTLPDSIRPYLEVRDGELVVDLLPGVQFGPESTRAELAVALQQLTQAGACVARMEQDHENGVTCFHVASGDRGYLLVFADELDRLVTVVPLHPLAYAFRSRLPN